MFSSKNSCNSLSAEESFIVFPINANFLLFWRKWQTCSHKTKIIDRWNINVANTHRQFLLGHQSRHDSKMYWRDWKMRSKHLERNEPTRTTNEFVFPKWAWIRSNYVTRFTVKEKKGAFSYYSVGQCIVREKWIDRGESLALDYKASRRYKQDRISSHASKSNKSWPITVRCSRF